jgi:hypothetical protein
MAFDPHKNLAISAVAVAPSPASSGTSLSVVTGQGALFQAAPFNVTISPPNVMQTPANAEIARVTAKTGDVFTIVRAQEGTTARAIAVGDIIAATITVKTVTDIESGLNFPEINTLGNVKAANLKWQQGHTWALVGDVTILPVVPRFFIPLIGTQASKMVGLRMMIASGTSIGVTLFRNGVAETGAITVTTTPTTTALNIALANNDAVAVSLSAPVGAPTTFSATLFLEHTL